MRILVLVASVIPCLFLQRAWTQQTVAPARMASAAPRSPEPVASAGDEDQEQPRADAEQHPAGRHPEDRGPGRRLRSRGRDPHGRLPAEQNTRKPARTPRFH